MAVATAVVATAPTCASPYRKPIRWRPSDDEDAQGVNKMLMFCGGFNIPSFGDADAFGR
jgi:hypothetical protein